MTPWHPTQYATKLHTCGGKSDPIGKMYRHLVIQGLTRQQQRPCSLECRLPWLGARSACASAPTCDPYQRPNRHPTPWLISFAVSGTLSCKGEVDLDADRGQMACLFTSFAPGRRYAGRADRPLGRCGIRCSGGAG